MTTEDYKRGQLTVTFDAKLFAEDREGEPGALMPLHDRMVPVQWTASRLVKDRGEWRVAARKSFEYRSQACHFLNEWVEVIPADEYPVYRGYRLGHDTAAPAVVVVYASPQSHPKRLQLHDARHSPTGFNWGYGGAGPTELACHLLTHAIGLRHFAHPDIYHAYKEDVIAKLDPVEPWTITAWSIRLFVADFRDERPDVPMLDPDGAYRKRPDGTIMRTYVL